MCTYETSNLVRGHAEFHPCPPNTMEITQNTAEVFKVFGKFEIRGFDEANAQLDVLIEKAEKLASLMSVVNGEKS